MVSHSENITVSIDTSRENRSWDTFVGGIPEGHHEQTSAWGAYRRGQGWNPYRVIVRTDKGILGGALILERPLKKVLSLAYVSRGPVCASNDPRLIKLTLDHVLGHIKRKRYSYLAITPAYGDTETEGLLRRSGFRPKPDRLPPSNLVNATTIIDLTADRDQILGRMRRTTRQEIRKSERSGLILSEKSVTDLQTFYELMCQLCNRRGVQPDPSHLSSLVDVWGHFQPAGWMKLFFLSAGSDVISAVLVFTFGDTVRAWKAGWTGTHDELRPNHGMWWQLIEWCKTRGFKKLELVHLRLDHALAVLAGESVNDSYWGVTLFKVGLGGETRILAPALYRSYQPLFQFCLNRGGDALLSSHRIASLIRRWSPKGSASSSADVNPGV